MNEEITLLFAVEAEQLLLSGFVEEAIDLLKKGIEKFPDYSAANAILAKAYTLLGKDDDANQTINNLKETNYFYSKIGFNSESATILNPDSLAPSIDFNENFEANPTFQSFNDLSINESNETNDTDEQEDEFINDFSNFNNNSNAKDEADSEEETIETENIEIEDLTESFDTAESYEEVKTKEDENLEIEDLQKSFDTAENFEEEETIETENIEIEDLTESFDTAESYEEVKTKEEKNLEIEDLLESFDTAESYEEVKTKEEENLEIEDLLESFDTAESYEEEETIETENIEIEDLTESFDTAESYEEEETIETENIEIEDLTESFDTAESYEEVKTKEDENLEIEDLLESFDKEVLSEEENLLEIDDFEDEIKKVEIESDLNSALDEIKGSSEFEEEENFIESNESDVIDASFDSNIENEVSENKDIEQDLESINTIENNDEKNNILELNSLIEDFSICNDSEINLGFIDTSEKLFNQDCEEFDIDEFIKKNSIKKEKKDFSIPFIDEEMKRIPSLVHPFKNFAYKPIKISYTEHLKYIDKIFNLEDDKKIIGLHFLGKNISSELYADEILHTNEKSEEKTKVNENYSFASETIARIYRQQGAFKEAIAAYKELMISDPTKKEYYQGEITQMMES